MLLSTMHQIIKAQAMKIIRTKHFISWLLLISSTYADSTLNTSKILRDIGDTMISPTGKFELRFFSPENSSNRYLGCGMGGQQRQSSHGYIKFTHGHRTWFLLVLNANGSIIWSTNTSRSVQSPVAQLLDSRNLVVRDANDDNLEKFWWQSFDYPTDTFLPGMKLGKNFVTGQEVYLRSGKNSSD